MLTRVDQFEKFLGNRKKANEWTNEGLSHPEVNICQGWVIFRCSGYYDPRDDWEHTRHSLNNPYMNKGHLFWLDLVEYIAMSEEAARRLYGKTGAERQALMNFGLHFLRELIIRDSDPDAEKHKASMKSALAALTDEQYRSFIRNLIVAEAMCFELSTEEDEHQTPSYNGELLTYVHSLIPKLRHSAFRTELEKALQSNINPMATRTSLSAFSRHGYRGVLDIYLNNVVEPSYEAWGKCFRTLVKKGDVEKVTISWSLFNDETQAALLIQDAHRLLSDVAKLGDAKLYGAVWKACKKNDAILDGLRTHQAKKGDTVDLLIAVCEIRSPKAFNQIWEACDPAVRAASINHPLRDPIPLLEAVARLKDPAIFEVVLRAYDDETKAEVHQCTRELISLLAKLNNAAFFERMLFSTSLDSALVYEDVFHLLEATAKLRDVALFRRVWDKLPGEKKAKALQAPTRLLKIACEFNDQTVFLDLWDTCRQYAPRAFNRAFADATELDMAFVKAVVLNHNDILELVLAAYSAEAKLMSMLFLHPLSLPFAVFNKKYPALLIDTLVSWHKNPGVALLDFTNMTLASTSGQFIQDQYPRYLCDDPRKMQLCALRNIYSSLKKQETILAEVPSGNLTKLAAIRAIQREFMLALPVGIAEELNNWGQNPVSSAAKGGSAVKDEVGDIARSLIAMRDYFTSRGASGRKADEPFIRRKNDFEKFISLLFEAEKMIVAAQRESNVEIKKTAYRDAFDQLMRKADEHIGNAEKQFKINGGLKFPGRKLVRALRTNVLGSSESYIQSLRSIWTNVQNLLNSPDSDQSTHHQQSIVKICQYLRNNVGDVISSLPNDPVSEAMNALFQLIAYDVQRQDNKKARNRHSDLRYLLDNLVELVSGLNENRTGLRNFTAFTEDTLSTFKTFLSLPLPDKRRRHHMERFDCVQLQSWYIKFNISGATYLEGYYSSKYFRPSLNGHLGGGEVFIRDGSRKEHYWGTARYYELRKHFFEVWLKYADYFNVRNNRIAFIELFNRLLDLPEGSAISPAGSASRSIAASTSDLFWYGIDAEVRSAIAAHARDYRITLSPEDRRIAYAGASGSASASQSVSATSISAGYTTGLLETRRGNRAVVRVSGQRATGGSAAGDAAGIPAEPDDQIATAAPDASAQTAEQIKAKLLSDPIECAAVRRREARQARVAKYTAEEDARRQAAIAAGDKSLSTKPRRAISARASAAADSVASASSEYSCEEVDLIEGAACGEGIVEAYSASDYSDGYSA